MACVFDIKKLLTLVLFFSLLPVTVGCSSHIDKRKFSGLRSAAKAIDSAVSDTTLSYERFNELLGKLTDETENARGLVSTEQEKSLLNSYEELLTTYKDGALLWEYKIGSFQYDWIPKGRIYVDAKVRTLMEKYRFPAESHVVELTNHHWESISADSLRVIWAKAHEQLKGIKTPFF
jgi:hypothetical protein